ncbi:MAG TPA: serine/threonine-protein kinase [Polyangiaceae bacterium]|nr:serine/threonine-protein kinase [Polyangiaceae bacterium]
MSTAPTPPSDIPEAPPAPRAERLGPYELLLELASGGMATVHLARATDRRQGPPLVAIKRPHRHLASDKIFVSMLVDEARLASAIDDPRVVKVRELGFEGGMPFIVMDYVEGASLAELRRELTAAGRAVDVRVAVRIVLDALGGLHAAHVLRDDNDKPLHLVHRDVSPHNVLIGCDGRSYITDFGIAKAEDRIQTTRTHEVKGKLAYLAPERVDKRRVCTVQSDVFSMAVVLWECFAGRRLFRGEEPVEILQQVMSSPIPTLEEIGAPVPRALDDVIARALSRDLDTRYGTALALAQAMERAAGPENIGTHADVARLMEAVFGARMAVRQNQVRATIGHELADLLRQSGLPARDPTATSLAPEGELLAQLAPPMPTGRYALGTELRAAMARLPRHLPWRSIAAVAAGVAIGAIVTLTVLTRHAKPAPIVVRGAPATIVAPTPTPTTRRVLLPLPFVASRATLDDETRDLDPPSDVLAFDVPASSGPRHRVTVVAPDGTRAEGYAAEQDGIVRPEEEGYAFEAPRQPGSATPRADRKRSAHPAGVVHDGFTKLR